MTPLRVAVLRGGPSPEYDVSLRTGGYFLEHLAPKHVPRDIFITKTGEWLSGGVPTTPERVFAQTDVVLNALHGAYGEDGKIQKLLEDHAIPYAGSRSLASSLGMQKHLARDILKNAGVKMPLSWIVRPEEMDSLPELLLEVRRRVAPPWVVKPSGSGSSLGVEYVWDPTLLGHALEKAFFLSPVALIEEYVRGEEATVLLLEEFRGKAEYVFFPVHIRKDRWSKYTYDDKKGASLRMECPADALSLKMKHRAEETARAVHRALGARHLSRTDMIINPNGVYVLEINTLPSFGSHTPAGHALRAAGVSDARLCSHLVELALSHA